MAVPVMHKRADDQKGKYRLRFKVKTIFPKNQNVKVTFHRLLITGEKKFTSNLQEGVN